jgi:radical SAM protein with 4Fe4S-binding SPASM domain
MTNRNDDQHLSKRTTTVQFRRVVEKTTTTSGSESLLNQCGDCSDCACQLITHDERAIHERPIIYSLELTPACNNRCPGCGNVFASCTPDVAPLSAERWRVLLDKIAPHARKLKVTGGEPTLHPEFYKIVTAIAERDMPFTLFTNARWRAPRKLLAFLQQVPQCVGLLISLHGTDAPSHEAFTGVQGSFEETMKNIRRATDAGFVVATSTVLTRHNVSRVKAMTEFALSLGADHAVFNRYLGAPLPEIEPSRAALRSAIKALEALLHQGIPVKYGNPVPQCFVFNSSHGCVAGKAYCTLDPWGNMRPCNHSPTIVGNLFEQSLAALWHSETMDQWRSLPPTECQSCPDGEVCAGGCKAMAELRTEGSDPLNVKHQLGRCSVSYAKRAEIGIKRKTA